MNWQSVAIFASGFACGAGAAVGTIAVLNHIEDKKKEEEKEGYEDEYARIMAAEGCDDNGAYVAINADPWNIDDGKAITYPQDVEQLPVPLEKVSEVLSHAAMAGATDAIAYNTYYSSTLANGVSEAMANPLINPASLLEDDNDTSPEADAEEEPTREDLLTGQFLKDPDGFNIPKNAVWLSYFGMDDTLCYDDNMQKTMNLESLFTVPISAAIRNAADLGDDGQSRFIVIDAKKAKIFVVDVLPHDSWSNTITIE